MFFDRKHFELGGYVDEQNLPILDGENPLIIHEKHTHPKRVTVWCSLWSGVVIGSHFFENAAGEAVSADRIFWF